MFSGFHFWFLLVPFILLTGMFGQAETVNVGPEFNDRSIVSAIEHCQAFDTLIIHPGDYREELIVINRKRQHGQYSLWHALYVFTF